jgi:hypothetical protein
MRVFPQFISAVSRRAGCGHAQRHSYPRLGRFLLLLVLLTACQRGDSQATATVRDSAGVTIVLNGRPSPPGSRDWSLSAEPVLSIGSVAGPEELQLYGVAGMHRISDGRIGVVNAGSRDVRFYGGDGRFLASYGKRGGGPEEFEAPALAGFAGDTLLVVDRAHHRLTFVHPDQGLVGLVRVSDEVGGFLNPVGSFASGQTVYGGAFDMRRIGELHNGMNRAHTFYRSSNLDGSLAVDFGDRMGAEFFIRDLEGSGQDSRPAVLPFGKLPVAAVSPGHFFFSDQDAWEVEVRTPDGGLVRLIRQEWDPVQVSEADRAAHIGNVVAQVGDPNQAAQIRSYLGGLPVPEHFPPFGTLMADLEDCLWVQDFQRPGAENRTWSIFAPDGVRIGRITFPERFNPAEIGSDYVLGVGWDEMNVEYVRMYGLRRPGRE